MNYTFLRQFLSGKSLFFIVSILCSAGVGVSAQESTSRSMSFENCLQVIRNTSQQLGVAPRNIVETSDLRMVRFVTSDGSVLVSCSRPDRKLVITKSD